MSITHPDSCFGPFSAKILIILYTQAHLTLNDVSDS